MLKKLAEINALVRKHAPGRSDLLSAIRGAEDIVKSVSLLSDILIIYEKDVCYCEEELRKEQAADGRRADGGEG